MAIPIGLQLTRTAHAVSHAFERAMAGAGGSAAAWQVLLLVRAGQSSTQSEMARQLGITAATVTHHLNALESRGLVRRWRDPGNKRIQQVELTADGLALFDRLRSVAVEHDARLRAALGDEGSARLGDLLVRLRTGLEESPQ
jgi:MarR family transcriptional regulator, transcriptional regulator for hemolysin